MDCSITTICLDPVSQPDSGGTSSLSTGHGLALRKDLAVSSQLFDLYGWGRPIGLR